MVRAEEMFSGRESQEFKKTIEGASKLLGKVDAYLEGQPVKKAPARPPADVAKASSPAPSTVTQAAPEPPAQLDACAAHWRIRIVRRCRGWGGRILLPNKGQEFAPIRLPSV
ncbi:hypothetical protein AK812_SmicGene34078 [Symbiodinium microadriaticum]|uniref:Uncharacterized protein n=1 Tax=Symbiodinium microadriaticum TaxID=2951 RepID=A0A1Q9CPX8_SYMMI|nr:hypothetical protein AK812_SmicGene34078 [Symbiodinium microadriaticum]